MKTRVLFSKYVLTGVLNTLIHWGVFFLLYGVFNASQATQPLLTLVFFSGLSLVLGFVYSRYIVFRA